MKTISKKFTRKKRYLLFNLLIALLVAGILIAAFYFKNENEVLSYIAVMANLATALSVLFLVLSQRQERAKAILDYFTQGDSEAIYEARLIVYEYRRQQNWGKSDLIEPMSKKELIALDRKYHKAFGTICNFYESWGILVDEGYLKLYLFENAAGYTAVRLYQILTPYILRRREDSPYYAENFETLAKRLEKRGIHVDYNTLW